MVQLGKNAINTALAIFMMISILHLGAQAQACKKIIIAPDTLKKQLLREFAQECRRNRYFIEDKGIIIIESYNNKQGQQVWSIYAMIDDRYKDNPPTSYDIIGDDIVLIYQADNNGRTSNALPANINAINQCLESIVSNRVYQRSSIKERYVEIQGIDHKNRKAVVRTIISGNYWNSKRIIFNKDGTYKMLIGV